MYTGDELDGGGGDDRLDPGPSPKQVGTIEPDLLVYAGADRGVTVDLSTGPSTGKAQMRGQGTDVIVWRERMAVVGSHHADRFIGSAAADHLIGLSGGDGWRVAPAPTRSGLTTAPVGRRRPRTMWSRRASAETGS